jgi:hypothetical protein
MTAVCPTCHDAIHHGSLEISDETIYEWKRIKRKGEIRSHVYVEPGQEPSIILGSVGIRGKAGARAFQMSETARLSFRVVDSDILSLNLDLNTSDGVPIVRVVENHVKYLARTTVDFKDVPGWVRITAPVSAGVVPAWVLSQMAEAESSFGPGGTITLLEIKVLKPGQAKVNGVWIDRGRYLIATDRRIYVSVPGWKSFSSFENLTLDLGDGDQLGTAFGFGG